MRPKAILAAIGFIAIIAGTYCPILRPFGLFNWNVFDANKPYGIVVLVVAIVGLAGTVINQKLISKGAAWVSLVLVVLLLIAAFMKVQTSFSFIPFKGIAQGLARLIKYKWGWYVLFAGAILAVLGNLGKDKPGIADFSRNNQQLQ
ncbi:hypothetical protein MUY27_09275 [Mucilaginibacter sp. RS28]|uniref:Uncharacterized protein n=1 Tax=Mucilaginibacter straminoryzae TaxID=2932774 RepID=A0A9X1X763_9SPHI|nr:hypothetical protein [Mucilaginibacter straminoryzae]MCJ8209899.1 hypothetical protein [Mucilaginibacter straminoryzae]